MQIPKQQILDMLRDMNQPGDPGKADQAERELPQQVDTDNSEHQNLLLRFGVDPQQLLKMFSSGGFSL
jgi:hypothetical protein